MYSKKTVSNGVVHIVPADLRAMLVATPKILEIWQDITPLARNEWLCWITSAKQVQTRDRRIRIMGESLLTGKRRPCCWVGCQHR